MQFENLEVIVNQKQKSEISSIPFLSLKEDILGKKYDLCVAFLNKKKAQKLNIKHRQKDYIPNTLSFPYSKTSGEIFLQLETIYSEAHHFEMSEQEFLLKIYIHSLLHLLGYDHSPEMDSLEEKYYKKYRLDK